MRNQENILLYLHEADVTITSLLLAQKNLAWHSKSNIKQQEITSNQTNSQLNAIGNQAISKAQKMKFSIKNFFSECDQTEGGSAQLI